MSERSAMTHRLRVLAALAVPLNVLPGCFVGLAPPGSVAGDAAPAPPTDGAVATEDATPGDVANRDAAPEVATVEDAPGGADACVAPSDGPVVNVRDFGARGDGVTDDLEAMRRAARYVSEHPGTTLYYPPGTYRIDQINHDLRGLPEELRMQQMGVRYENCQNIRVVGCHAKIDVKGDFHKTPWGRAEVRAGVEYWTAHESQLIPFIFSRCSNFTLSGFEIDGNVDQMTRDPRVRIEDTEYGVMGWNSHHYEIRDVYVHHFATDGLLLGMGDLDHHFTIRNVVSAHNARQALSLAQVRNGLVIDSVFRDTGFTGTFGAFGPSAGVDLEPDCVPPGQPGANAGNNCPGFDRRGGHVTFERVQVLDNLGWGIVSGNSNRIEDVTIRDSHLRSPPGSVASPLALFDGVIERSRIEAARGRIDLSGGTSTPDNEVFVRDNDISGDDILLYAETSVRRVVIENNAIRGTFRGSESRSGLNFIRLVNPDRGATPGWEFRNNRVFVPHQAALTEGCGNYLILLAGLAASELNVFDTDGDRAMCVHYGGTARIVRDRFLRPTALMPADGLAARLTPDGYLSVP